MNPTGATKESTKFTFEVVTGRHKIYRGLDQIATADDGESAQLIINALNERVRLREVLRQSRQYLTQHICTVGYSSQKHVTYEVRELVARIDAALNEVEG